MESSEIHRENNCIFLTPPVYASTGSSDSPLLHSPATKLASAVLHKLSAEFPHLKIRNPVTETDVQLTANHLQNVWAFECEILSKTEYVAFFVSQDSRVDFEVFYTSRLAHYLVLHRPEWRNRILLVTVEELDFPSTMDLSLLTKECICFQGNDWENDTGRMMSIYSTINRSWYPWIDMAARQSSPISHGIHEMEERSTTDTVGETRSVTRTHFTTKDEATGHVDTKIRIETEIETVQKSSRRSSHDTLSNAGDSTHHLSVKRSFGRPKSVHMFGSGHDNMDTMSMSGISSPRSLTSSRLRMLRDRNISSWSSEQSLEYYTSASHQSPSRPFAAFVQRIASTEPRIKPKFRTFSSTDSPMFSPANRSLEVSPDATKIKPQIFFSEKENSTELLSPSSVFSLDGDSEQSASMEVHHRHEKQRTVSKSEFRISINSGSGRPDIERSFETRTLQPELCTSSMEVKFSVKRPADVHGESKIPSKLRFGSLTSLQERTPSLRELSVPEEYEDAFSEDLLERKDDPYTKIKSQSAILTTDDKKGEEVNITDESDLHKKKEITVAEEIGDIKLEAHFEVASKDQKTAALSEGDNQLGFENRHKTSHMYDAKLETVSTDIERDSENGEDERLISSKKLLVVTKDNATGHMNKDESDIESVQQNIIGVVTEDNTRDIRVVGTVAESDSEKVQQSSEMEGDHNKIETVIEGSTDIDSEKLMVLAEMDAIANANEGDLEGECDRENIGAGNEYAELESEEQKATEFVDEGATAFDADELMALAAMDEIACMDEGELEGEPSPWSMGTFTEGVRGETRDDEETMNYVTEETKASAIEGDWLEYFSGADKNEKVRFDRKGRVHGSKRKKLIRPEGLDQFSDRSTYDATHKEIYTESNQVSTATEHESVRQETDSHEAVSMETGRFTGSKLPNLESTPNQLTDLFQLKQRDSGETNVHLSSEQNEFHKIETNATDILDEETKDEYSEPSEIEDFGKLVSTIGSDDPLHSIEGMTQVIEPDPDSGLMSSPDSVLDLQTEESEMQMESKSSESDLTVSQTCSSVDRDITSSMISLDSNRTSHRQRGLLDTSSKEVESISPGDKALTASEKETESPNHHFDDRPSKDIGDSLVVHQSEAVKTDLVAHQSEAVKTDLVVHQSEAAKTGSTVSTVSGVKKSLSEIAHAEKQSSIRLCDVQTQIVNNEGVLTFTTSNAPSSINEQYMKQKDVSAVSKATATDQSTTSSSSLMTLDVDEVHEDLEESLSENAKSSAENSTIFNEVIAEMVGDTSQLQDGFCISGTIEDRTGEMYDVDGFLSSVDEDDSMKNALQRRKTGFEMESSENTDTDSNWENQKKILTGSDYEDGYFVSSDESAGYWGLTWRGIVPLASLLLFVVTGVTVYRRYMM